MLTNAASPLQPYTLPCKVEDSTGSLDPRLLTSKWWWRDGTGKDLEDESSTGNVVHKALCTGAKFVNGLVPKMTLLEKFYFPREDLRGQDAVNHCFSKPFWYLACRDCSLFPCPTRPLGRAVGVLFLCSDLGTCSSSGCSSPCTPEPGWPPPRPCQDHSGFKLHPIQLEPLTSKDPAAAAPDTPPGASSVLLLPPPLPTQPECVSRPA